MDSQDYSNLDRAELEQRLRDAETQNIAADIENKTLLHLLDRPSLVIGPYKSALVASEEEVISLGGQLLSEQEKVGHLIQEVLRYHRRSTHDPLTGLFTKEHIGKLAMRYGELYGEYGLVNIDAIGFGQINKNHNIIAGDAAICSIADRLSRVFRPEDSIGRYGGDEFWVLLPKLNKKLQRSIKKRIEKEVNRPLTVEQMRGYLSKFYDDAHKFQLKDGCTQLDIKVRYTIEKRKRGESLMGFIERSEEVQKINREREKTARLTYARRSTDAR